jgi:hypothetical protein
LLVASIVAVGGAAFAQVADLDYRTYSEILAKHFTPAPGYPLYIVSHTAGYVLDESAVNGRCRAVIPHELVERYNKLNTAKHSVEDKFTLSDGVRHAVVATEKGLKLSRIAFNQARDECLLYVDDNRRGVPSARHGRLMRLKKEDGAWVPINRCQLW